MPATCLSHLTYVESISLIIFDDDFLAFNLAAMPATCLSHLTYVESITLIIFDDEYKLRNSAFPKTPPPALDTFVYKPISTLSSETISEKLDVSVFRA
jgi:hypothetical protein